MPLTLHWTDIVVRLALATFAGTVVGLNRTESGKTAGLRTMLLVCLAACLAMLQVNALLLQAGKQPGSFAVLDLMRLPLGILSGVGFIGAGAILRKDGLITGVTTAATLWFVTVIGLCIGGGQYLLGIIGIGLALAILWGLRIIERKLPRENRAQLTVEYARGSDYRDALIRHLREGGCAVTPKGLRLQTAGDVCEERFEVRWRERENVDAMPLFLTASAVAPGASRVCWSVDE